MSETVPELAAGDTQAGKPPLISDLRLLDLVIWTAMDDRLAVASGRPMKWIGGPVGTYLPYETIASEPIRP